MKAMNTYLHILIIQNWQNRLWFLKSFLSDTVNVGSVHAVLLKVRVYRHRQKNAKFLFTFTV